jgi:hypothetical protein|tara:strand:+ start:1500 stop:1712 length:213 start_codon:yes stop_codon:yes gene_type:complete
MSKHILAPDKWVELQAEISGEWLQDVVSEYPYVTQKNGDVTYTDKAQSEFNSIYDKVDDIISSIFEKGDN